MNGYAAQVKAALAQHGWKILRSGKGSHEVWIGPSDKTVSVNHVCKSRHTANAIMKAAGIKLKF